MTSETSAFEVLEFCIETIKNPRIPNTENGVWSSGSYQKPTITQKTLEDCLEALKKAEAYDRVVESAAFLLDLREPIEIERSIRYQCAPLMVNQLVVQEFINLISQELKGGSDDQ